MNRTTIDWWAFRTTGEPREALAALHGAFPRPLALRHRDSGYMGYESAADVLLGDGMKVGLMAWGGWTQRDWVMVSLTGRGCEWVTDWDRAQEATASLPSMQLRRVDIALDTRDGSVSHERVVRAHRDGEFTTRGRPPGMRRIESEGPGAGRTVTIGNRQEAKFFRGYEKGRELVKGFPSSVAITHIDGVPIDDLYRCEVELKPKNGPLPEDLIDRRDQYFAGCYPFLDRLLGDVTPEIFVQSRERGPQRDLAAALAQVRYHYGTILFTALSAHHGDFLAVWDQIVGTKHNEALVRAGALLVDHDNAGCG